MYQKISEYRINPLHRENKITDAQNPSGPPQVGQLPRNAAPSEAMSTGKALNGHVPHAGNISSWRAVITMTQTGKKD